MGGRRGRLISTPDRMEAIKLIKEAVIAGANEQTACAEIGISWRTLQRWRSHTISLEDQRPLAKRPVPKNKLSEEETQTIIETVCVWQSRIYNLPIIFSPYSSSYCSNANWSVIPAIKSHIVRNNECLYLMSFISK